MDKFTTTTSLHQLTYGRNDLPEANRCCVEVFREKESRSTQCHRVRGHGPEGAFCYNHSPATVAAKKAARLVKSKRAGSIDMVKTFSMMMLTTLDQIAEGHNDPRGLAKEVLGKIAPFRPE